ncbi:MAG: DUF547 domain-containing protein [Saprospiraceae bacterium]|nr:DUF547 domain-containing protein [Saprospiraceae bacterium]
MLFDEDLIKFSQDFLQVAQKNQYTKSFRHHLQYLDKEQLKIQLIDDAHKTVFWVNVYNAFVQSLLKEAPSLYRNLSDFHNRKRIVIAQHKISLHLIEHSIIRRTRARWRMSSFEKEFCIEAPNPLIHFSLNAACISAPPIDIYTLDQYNEQLHKVTEAYLQKEALYMEDKNMLLLPKLLQWYKKDFGGNKGLTAFVQKYQLVPQEIKPKLRFQPFDTAIALNAFCIK